MIHAMDDDYGVYSLGDEDWDALEVDASMFLPNGEVSEKHPKIYKPSENVHINNYHAMFSQYARPDSSSLPISLEFLLVDAECMSARIRIDMDDPEVDHTPVICSIFSQNPRKRKSSEYIVGPVIKLYGVCLDGTSVCIDVYGYYPTFRLQVVKGTASQNCLDRIRDHIEKVVLYTPDSIQPDKPRKVVKANVTRAFSAFPYNPNTSIFYEYQLTRPQEVRKAAEYFAKNTELDDEYSENGVLGIIPHSGEDTLTQYMVKSGISGFGWVRVSNPSDPFDSNRSEIEMSPCSYVGDCKTSSICAINNKDDMAPLRVLGLDIECIKDEGMPDPRKNPIIIIGVVACITSDGVVDPNTMRKIVFTWFQPGSGGVANISGVDQV